MTINVQTGPVGNPEQFLYRREYIQSLARYLVANQIEGHLEMMCDFPVEYKTFGEVAGCVKTAKESVVDYIEDLLSEFRDRLLAEVANVDIEVDAVVFKKDGDIDVEVNVSTKENGNA